MTSIKDYRLPDGNTDWAAYRKAEIANGDRCYQCGHFIILGDGFRSRCRDCRDAEKPEELTHSCMVRCPFCGEMSDAGERGLFEDGEHDIMCYECDKEFSVATNVSYTFTSPRMEKREEEEEEE